MGFFETKADTARNKTTTKIFIKKKCETSESLRDHRPDTEGDKIMFNIDQIVVSQVT